MRAKKPDATPALLDVILSVLAFVLVLINDPTEGAVELKVDYVLEVSWPEGISVDVDTYVMRPDDRVMSYTDKDTGNVSIDRDDLGNRNDPAPPNIEITNFRAPQDGRYYVSVHTYRTVAKRDEAWQVHIVFKDNKGKVLWHKAVPLPPVHEETPIMTFLVKDGKVISHRESERRIVRRYTP